MQDSLMSMLPLLIMTMIGFFINRWIGKRCNVWTTSIALISVIPILSYFASYLIFTKAIEQLNSRMEELEAKFR
jgi:hypothetical protein